MKLSNTPSQFKKIEEKQFLSGIGNLMISLPLTSREALNEFNLTSLENSPLPSSKSKAIAFPFNIMSPTFSPKKQHSEIIVTNVQRMPSFANNAIASSLPQYHSDLQSNTPLSSLSRFSTKPARHFTFYGPHLKENPLNETNSSNKSVLAYLQQENNKGVLDRNRKSNIRKPLCSWVGQISGLCRCKHFSLPHLETIECISLFQNTKSPSHTKTHRL
jgi:hypothetical protein